MNDKNPIPHPLQIKNRRWSPLWLPWFFLPGLASQVSLAQGAQELPEPIQAAVEARIEQCNSRESFLVHLGFAKDPNSDSKFNSCSRKRDLLSPIRGANDKLYTETEYGDDQFRQYANDAELLIMTEIMLPGAGTDSESGSVTRFSEKTQGDTKSSSTVLTVRGYQTITN